MRGFKLLVLAVIASSSTALVLDSRQTNQALLGTLPQCPQTCLDELFPQYGCGPQDESCLCGTGEPMKATETCVTTNCTLRESLDLQHALSNICDRSIPNRGELTRRLAWAMFAIATFFTLCRFLSRSPTFGGTGYSWDDWTLLFCYVLLVPTDVSAETEVQNGLGLDAYMVPTANIVEILRWFYVGETLYNIIVMVTKISILLLYLRIWTIDSTTRRFRMTCWILISVLAAITVMGVFTVIFQCTPISYAWLQATGTAQGHCIQLSAFSYAYAALDITFDAIVFLLPIRNLLNLEINWWKKFGVIIVFLCGFFVTICSIIRLQYLVRLSDTTNLTWDFQYIGMWSLVECNFSIVCVCMPAMAGLLQRVWSGTFRMRTLVVTKGEKDRLVEEIEGNLQKEGRGKDNASIEQGYVNGGKESRRSA